MLDIVLLAEAHFTKSKALRTALTDKARNEALEYYKKIVVECETLCSSGTAEDKVKRLELLVGQVEKDLAQKISPPDVLDLLFLYIRYAAYSIKKTILDASNTHLTTLAQLDVRIKSKISKFYVDLDVTDPQQENPALPENICLAASANAHLPSANKFRGDPWRNKLTTLPYVGRYSSITTHIGTLEGIAKSIVHMESVFQEQIANATRTYVGKDSLDALIKTLDDDCTTCLGIERLIAAQFRQLKEVPIVAEVHAGWNYAASLFTQATVLRSSIIAFRQNAVIFGAYAHATTMLKQCIKPPTASSEASSCYRLWALTQSACLIPRELLIDSSVYTVLRETIGQIGFRTLALTQAEKDVVKLGPWDAKKADSAQQTYLIKGMMRFLHFPAEENRGVDFEFQKVFYTLKYDPAYKNAFEACLKGSHEFRSLHDAYIGQYEKLYSHLVQYQFKLDEKEKADLYDKILDCVETSDFEKTPLVGVVKTLLYRWVLLRFDEFSKQPQPKGFFQSLVAEFDSTRIDNSSQQQLLLKNLFDEYCSDPEQKKFWADVCGQDYMDKAVLAYAQHFPAYK